MTTNLPIICDGTRGPEIDIVCVPCLQSVGPCQSRDESAWIRTTLRGFVPGGRLMALKYSFSEPLTWILLLKQVDHLLWILSSRREAQPKRPLMFICHSLGAMILKRALLYAESEIHFRDIFEACIGIVFIGCIHNARHTSFYDACLQCAAVELSCLSSARQEVHLAGLRTDETSFEMIRKILHEFKQLDRKWRIRTFYAAKPTLYEQHRLSWSNKSRILCDEDAATLGWCNEVVIPVDMDHEQIIRFPDRADPFLDQLIEQIAAIVRGYVSPDAMPVLHRAVTVPSLGTGESVTVKLATVSLKVKDQPLALSDTASSFVIEPKLPCFVLTQQAVNPAFHGRREVLDMMYQALSAHGRKASAPTCTFALCGLGGMGKTQTAIKFAYDHRNDYEAVFWAHADTPAKMLESFARFAVELGLLPDSTSNHNHACQTMLDWLSATPHTWLLIFDNVISGIDLNKFLPRANMNGTVLITSRDSTLIGQHGGHRLQALDSESAVQMLFSLTPNISRMLSESVARQNDIDAREVVQRVGHLPLAIQQVANVMLHDNCTTSEFLSAYDNRDLIERSGEMPSLVSDQSGYSESLRTVWSMNFERLKENEQKLLWIMSFLDPDRIQLSLFENRSPVASQKDLSFVTVPRELHEAVTGLAHTSLIQKNEEQEISVHRLIQASCQLRMNIAEKRTCFSQAIALVKAQWPAAKRSAVHDPSLWKEQQALLPHIVTLCKHYKTSTLASNPEKHLLPNDESNWELPKLLYEAGWHCYERGQLSQAASLFEPAKDYCQLHKNEPKNVLRADIHGGLGSLCTESNRFQEAHDHFERQFTYVKQALDIGELERPSIWEVFALGRLANGLHGLHRYGEAESYYRRCLEAFKQVPGDQKIWKTHLATCMWLQGRLQDAEDQVKPLIKDWHDASNFRTGQAIYAAGNIFAAQAQQLEAGSTNHSVREAARGYFDRSFEAHKQAFELFRKILGAKHHKTADATYKVAWHLHRMDKHQDALEKLNHALEIYNNAPDSFANEIARTRYKKGCILQDMGKIQEGRTEIGAAERMRQKIVPPENWTPAEDETAYDEIVQFWTR